MEFINNHKLTVIDLILKNNCKKVAEIGVWKSHLVRNVLRSECINTVDEYWAIDQWKVLGKEHGRMSKRSSENWDDLYFNCCKYMPYFKQLKTLRMTSEKASKLFKDEYFDLIFIDASHLYIDVLNDLKYWYPKIKKNGIFCGHDYVIGTRGRKDVTDALNTFFGENQVDVFPTTVWVKK